MIRKENVLCCKGNNLITVIRDLKKPYIPKRKKFNKKNSQIDLKIDFQIDLDFDEEDSL